MPTYQYECESCGYKFEVMQSITEPKKKDCPECNKPSLFRLIGQGGGLIFKGSGFYQTDYKKKEPKSPQPCPGGDSEKCNSCPANSQQK